MDADFREKIVQEATANGFVVTVNETPDLEFGQDEAVELRIEGKTTTIARFRGTSFWGGYVLILSAYLVYSATDILACLGGTLDELHLAPCEVYNVLTFMTYPERSELFWKRLKEAAAPSSKVA